MASQFMELTSHSPQETQEIGRLLGQRAEAGDLFLLAGGLGVGKTCLTQGIAWGLGVTEYARSPTFVLVTQYPARLTLYHIDLYRLDNSSEIYDLGLEEYLFGDGVCVVEWAEKAPEIFPGDHLLIKLQPTGEEERHLSLESRGQRYQKLVEETNLKQHLSGGKR